ncbi:hypothetical protein [Sphingomonas sp. ERG5]|uniref:hypothetical protein n=1 Tax=Sphingomonas sp. ERG5 TaxID=1381597 RepID=UPI001364DF49|nr:hypothetical protein [Sphingomonas sp. ERG5]
MAALPGFTGQLGASRLGCSQFQGILLRLAVQFLDELSATQGRHGAPKVAI